MDCCVYIAQDENNTRELAKRLTSFLQVGDVLALEGDLGAGKTTFAQGIAKGLGVTQKVDSPTFAIIKEYVGHIPLYHMDVYRLETGGEELGLEEYFYGDGICIVEWASKVKSLLPDQTIYLSFTLKEDGTRSISITPPSSRSELCKELTL